jgi:CubicO group peptidase (beta-lactamase class C family)
MFKQKLLASTALLLACLCAQSQAAIDVDALLKQAMEGTKTPAVGVLIIRGGKIDEQAVRGLRRADQPDKVAIDDTWLIGSTGKVMTTALIARLVERDVLSWSATLEQMLPDLAAQMQPAYRSVTLVELLSHRAGLPENLRDLAYVDRFFSDSRALPEQRLDLATHALGEAPEKTPGSEFVYSNSGFVIAAVIAERATQQSFETLIQQEVFAPLGMRHAGFGPTTGAQPRGHRGGAPVIDAPHITGEGVPLAYAPAGNLHMSLQDWALFCIDQLAGSHGHGKLLSLASYQLMQRAQPNSPAGLDWGVQASIAGRQGPVWVHGGSDGNWLAWVALFPATDNGVLVVANATADMGADRATHAVLGAIFPDLSPALASKQP